jgi:hypothetical protein
MIAAGASLCGRTNDGYSALTIAIRSGHKAIAMSLLKANIQQASGEHLSESALAAAIDVLSHPQTKPTKPWMISWPEFRDKSDDELREYAQYGPYGRPKRTSQMADILFGKETGTKVRRQQERDKRSA